jgi:hypothetical protein
MRKSIVMVCCLALLAAGCGGSNRPPTPDETEEGALGQVGNLLLYYQSAKNKPPEKLADLASVKQMGTNGYEAIRDGQIVLRYGASLPDTKEEPGGAPSDEVVAYQSQVPESGGKVLLLNRTVKTMTADQFKSAKLAGKEGPAPAAAKAK